MLKFWKDPNKAEDGPFKNFFRNVVLYTPVTNDQNVESIIFLNWPLYFLQDVQIKRQRFYSTDLGKKVKRERKKAL